MSIISLDLVSHTNILKISSGRHLSTVGDNTNVVRITSTLYENINNTAVNNHSLLNNLDSDDHTQYHNDTRGDVRYYRKTQLGSLALLNTVNNTNWSGTALSVVNGGTGVTTISDLRTALGLGTIYSQDSNNVSITGGIINGTNIGATTPSSGKFTTVTVTSVTGLSAGTALLPSLIPTGDPNTGLWFPAADTIAFSVGGIEKFRITSAGLLQAPRSTGVVTTAVSAVMDDSATTWVVTASGQTLTLPASSTARIGSIWRTNLSAVGTLTVQRAGADTIMTPDSAVETSVILTIRGMTLDFMCNSATTWIIV